MGSSVPGNIRAEKRLMEVLTGLLIRGSERIEREMEATFAGGRLLNRNIIQVILVIYNNYPKKEHKDEIGIGDGDDKHKGT